MDKNIVAIVREDTRTIQVAFDESARRYTYVTTRTDLASGDIVVVPVQDRDADDFKAVKFKVATVTQVDDGLNIAPNAQFSYRWVVDKVDFTQYWADEEANARLYNRLVQEDHSRARRHLKSMVLPYGMMVEQILKGDEQ